MSVRPELHFAQRRNNRNPLGIGALAAIAVGIAFAVMVGRDGGDVPEQADEFGGIVVQGTWMRPAPAGGSTAAYMVLRNAGTTEDRLLGASFPDAAVVEIHETVMEGDVARMEPRPDGLPLPGGSETELAPMGKHIMLVDLERPLEEGATETLVLRFERAGEYEVKATVQLGP